MPTTKTRQGPRLRALAVIQAVLLMALVAPLPVAAAGESVDSVSPSAMGQGASGTVVVTGNGWFVSGSWPASAVVFGSGITVNSVTYLNASNLSVAITVSSSATPGLRNVTVTNPVPGGLSATGNNLFTVNLKPTVTSASPNHGGQGATLDVDINGADFSAIAFLPTVAFSGSGIAVNLVTFNSATQLTANITIDPAAATTARTITVTNPDGGVGTGGSFTVDFVQSTPSVDSASPSQLAQGATAQNVTIIGSDFRPGATVSFGGGGITLNGAPTFVTSTALLVNITVSQSAAVGLRNVTVTNPDLGTDTGGVFTVVAGPTVSSASPGSLNQGATAQNVVVFGSGFQAGASVTFSGTGVSASVLSVAGDGSSLTASVTVSASAPAGKRDITVANPGPDFGTGTGSQKFEVKAVVIDPTVVSASPSSALQGTSNLNVTIFGSGFQPGATVAFSGGSITLNGAATWNSATSLTQNITISASATASARNVTVTNPDAGFNIGYGIFTVTAAASPVVNYASPDRLPQGTVNGSVTVYGSNFSTGSWGPANVSFSGLGISVLSVSRTSSSSLQLAISIAGTATAGWRNITVTNPDGSGSGIGYSIFQVTTGLHLEFTSYPASTTSSALSPQPAVRLLDGNGVLVTAAADQVTVRLSVNPTSASFTCTNGVTRTLVNGVASFTGCTLPAGTYTMTAAPDLVGSPIVPITGPSFTVLDKRIVFSTQPGGTNAAAGAALPTQPVVAVQNAAGTLLSTHNSGTITLTIATGPTGATLACTGGNSKAIVNGLATFTGCQVSAAGTNYTLTATYTPTLTGELTLPAVTSSVFSVAASAAAINLRSSATIVTSGQGFTLTAQFATGGSGLVVTFQKKTTADADWQTIGTVTATSTGLASLLWAPTYTGQYRATSGTVISNVVSVSARFNIGVLTPTYTGTKTLAKGTRVTYTVKSRPLGPGNVNPTVTFQIYKMVDGVWTFQTSATVKSNVDGIATFSWTWSKSGTWYMRGRVNATAYNSGIFTNLARVRIN